MTFFISNALADSHAAAPGEPGFTAFLPLIVLFVVFYFFLIRPQMKQQKEHSKMVDALTKGDEAVTNGGLLGRITEVGENFIKMEISKGIEVKVQRRAIAQVMPKGTVKGM
ncbi:MAG: preprotein translocase subunit YajC [Pseudomonadota bacterium]